MCFCCFRFFTEYYLSVVKVNNFESYSLLEPLDQANFMFLAYVIKIDKREVHRLYFEHIYVLLLFSVFTLML